MDKEATSQDQGFSLFWEREEPQPTASADFSAALEQEALSDLLWGGFAQVLGGRKEVEYWCQL